jgi:PAS domain-containing protein
VWCLLSTTVMNADSGHYAGMLAMLTDITARRQAEGALHESSQRLASIFNAVTNGLVMVDAHGLILERNAAAARMLAHTEELSRDGLWAGVREDSTLTTPAATRCNWRWSPACRCATW